MEGTRGETRALALSNNNFIFLLDVFSIKLTVLIRFTYLYLHEKYTNRIYSQIPKTEFSCENTKKLKY